MDVESKSGIQVKFTRASGKMTKLKAMAAWQIQTAMFTKANGSTTWVTVLVFSFKFMVQNSKVNLKKINNKASALKNGVMELSIEDITLTEWNMGKVSLHGLTKVFTKVTSSKMKWKEMVFKVGLTVDATLEAGKVAWWMA